VIFVFVCVVTFFSLSSFLRCWSFSTSSETAPLYAAVGVVALVTGCSSATNKGDAGVTDPGIDPNNPNKCADKNPAGDCYPTANQGYNPRKGQVAGNRIPNFKFIGYRSANGAATPSTGDTETIQLADFFDPKGEKYKVIRVVVASVWCGPCNQETDYIVQNNLATDLNGQGAVFLQALSDGPVVGTGATLLADDQTLEYAIIELKESAKVADRAPLRLVEKPPPLTRGARLNIVQHSGGGPQRFGLPIGVVQDVFFAGAITPVPGGVGPMTITMLLSNTVDAAGRTLET